MGPVAAPPKATKPKRLVRRKPLEQIPATAAPPPAVSQAVQAAITSNNEPACCETPEYDVSDGVKVCTNCGTLVSESNIVAEVTFGETATGAATVQGGFVGEGARHAKTLGAAASRRIGGGGGSDAGGAAGGRYASREETEANGRAELRALCPQLRIPPAIEEVAFNLWKLAASHNFIQGRRTGEVAGVCLYAACRRESHNTILLMDISEALAVNVFKLGDTYKELSRELYLEVHSHVRPVAEIEPLLMKYCLKLEFGDKTRQVAEDAAKIIRRMKRDWMVTGRHPAGLCGACIILAARMNNFRRTVREVVYVVKVADMTIVTRLNEFQRTRSAGMSVKDFRENGLRLKFAHDPPSLRAAEERQQKLEEKRKRREFRQSQRAESEATSRASSTAPGQAPAEIAGELGHASGNAAAQQATPPATQTQAAAVEGESETPEPPRRDADGFVIPALPSSQAAQDKTKKKRGRPKGKPTPVVQFTAEDFAKEEELEHDIENMLQDPNCVSARDDAEREKVEARAKAIADEQRALSALSASSPSASAARLSPTGGAERLVSGHVSTVSDDPDIHPDEFADDPEVQNALLDEDAVRIKETIWLRDNEDWLRAQQAKHLKGLLDAAEGRSGADKNNPNGSSVAGGKGGAGGKRKRKRARMGDGSVLEEKGTPVLSPADAAQRMLDKHAGKSFSRSVDYAALNRVFGGNVGPTEHEAKRLKREAARASKQLGRKGSGAGVGSSTAASSSTRATSRASSVSSDASSATTFSFVDERGKALSGSTTHDAHAVAGASAASAEVDQGGAEGGGLGRKGSRDEPLEVDDAVAADEDDDDDDDEGVDDSEPDRDGSEYGGYQSDAVGGDSPRWGRDEDDVYDDAVQDATGTFGMGPEE